MCLLALRCSRRRNIIVSGIVNVVRHDIYLLHTSQAIDRTRFMFPVGAGSVST